MVLPMPLSSLMDADLPDGFRSADPECFKFGYHGKHFATGGLRGRHKPHVKAVSF